MTRREHGFVVLIASAALAVYFSMVAVARARGAADVHWLTAYDPSQRYYPADRWDKSVSPELLDWSSERLSVARRFSEGLDTAAVVIVDNGVIVYEWGSTDKRYKAHSMRKSLLNALYGIHVGLGTITLAKTLKELGIDDSKPSLTESEKQATVADLLKSRSGIYHRAAYESKSMRKKRPERGSQMPGTFWYYNNWDFNALLTIFEQETGTRIFTEFKKEIADPLQMEHLRLRDMKYQYNYKYSTHPAYLFKLSARDLARFGLLYLRNGRWRDEQIVPASWVKQSTTAYSQTKPKPSAPGYGYLWWIYQDHYAAAGRGGHRLFVYPHRDLVIVHRVDTSQRGRSVKDRHVRELVTLIIAARQR